MHGPFRFADLAESLKNGFLADEVVLAAARVQRDGQVDQGERRTFERAAEVLGLALEGYGWVNDPKLGPRSSMSANFFSQAVDALPKTTSREIFAKNLSELRDTAQKLAQQEVPNQERIASLRNFFFQTGESELTRTERILGDKARIDPSRWGFINE